MLNFVIFRIAKNNLTVLDGLECQVFRQIFVDDSHPIAHNSLLEC